MGGDNVDRLERYELKRLRAARHAGIIMALVVVVYIVLAEFSLVPRAPYYHSWSAYTVAILIGLVSLYQLLRHKVSLISQGVIVGLTHLLGAFLIVFITGFMTPIALIWLLLITICDLFFSRYVTLMSVVALYAVMLTSFALTPSPSGQELLFYIIYATAIVILGWFFGELRSIQADEHSDLVNTRKREISQQNQLMTLINSMSQAVISITTSGHIQLYNSATLDLLDTNQNLSGRSFVEVFRLVNEQGDSVDILKEMDKSGHTMQRDDLSYKLDDDDLIHLDINSSVIYGSDNQINGRIIIIRDITKAKTFDEERDEFISIVSHELRTPITIAEGTISNMQLLIDREASKEVINQSVNAAHEQVVYLSKMINDLSTLSRAERGVGDDPELIDLRSLGEHLFNEYLTKAEAHKLALNIELPQQRIYAYTSRLYLEEVLQNLLTNAIKYTPKGSVTLAIEQNGTKSARISVADTGVGISKSDQKKVFTKFYRSEDYRTRETSGTGLGLYIVSKLAHKLKINLELESSINKGSKFSFTIKQASKQQIDKYRDVK